LVVITIIGILIALLLPAVQSAREAARQTQCCNHLKQLGLGSLQHLEAHGHFPSGGWGWNWVGDPDRGFTRRQPAGWVYNILPYIEQEALHQLGEGEPTAEKRKAAGQVIATPLELMNCPTRRPAIAYPGTGGLRNAVGQGVGARGDYAMCTGSAAPNEFCGGPSSLDEGDRWPNCQDLPPGEANPCGGASGDNCWRDMSDHNGISYQRSEVRMSQVRDGASNTLMIGEKYLIPDEYTTGTNPADNETMYAGYDNDNFRNTYQGRTPQRDREGLDIYHYFGSAHPAGCHFVFCDGSVHRIDYSIDPDVFRILGDRADGEPLDAAEF
jgi:hypothetical protein